MSRVPFMPPLNSLWTLLNDVPITKHMATDYDNRNLFDFNSLGEMEPFDESP